MRRGCSGVCDENRPETAAWSTWPWFVVAILWALFVVNLLTAEGCAKRAKPAREGDLSDDTVVAVVGDTTITYGKIWPRDRTAREGSPGGAGDVRWPPEDVRRQYLVARLRSYVFEALTDNAVREHGIRVSAEEASRRGKEMFAESISSEPERRPSPGEVLVRRYELIATWLRDNVQGEALYEREFTGLIDRQDWEVIKRVAAEKGLPPPFSADYINAQYEESYTRRARTALLRQRLTDRLRELGELDKDQPLHVWLSRQLSTVEFPVRELKLGPRRIEDSSERSGSREEAER